MVDWTDEAVEAAIKEWNLIPELTNYSAVRAALDAAVKAQGGVYLTDGEADALSEANSTGYERGHAAGRAEALEEAEKVLDARHEYYQNFALKAGLDTGSDYWHADQLAMEDAAAIRALKDKPQTEREDG